ncbi:MAG TPA: MBL fold metallo-hydrolase [Candidatus Tectomicrobia bacterium]
MDADGTLTFWGVRGSIPSPGLHTITFGGNTSCVSVEYHEHVIIFDAGSGLRPLGLALMARGTPPITGSLFLTHTHWDHIQGLPFFTPAFTPQNQFAIYGEARPRYPLVELMEDQIQHPFFPIEMQDLFQAHIDFRELASGDTVEIDPQIQVTAFRLTHPNAALGYVLQLDALRVAYVTDHEHPLEHLSPAVQQAVTGVDLLIHDAQYSREEIRQGKQGWGHSAWEDVVQLALEAQVHQLFLFHHDPTATDEHLNERQFLAQQIFPQTFVAREGLKIPLHSARRG